MHLRTKLALLISALIIAVMAPLSFFTVLQTARIREADMDRRSTTVAKLIAQVEIMGVIAGKPVPPHILQEQVALCRGMESSIVCILVGDSNNRLLAGDANAGLLARHGIPAARQTLNSLAAPDGLAWPDLRAKTVKISDGQRDYGQVKVAFSLLPLQAEIRRASFKYLLLTVGFVLLGIFVSCLFSRWIARPLEQLAHATDRIRQGDLTARVEVKTRDEIGRLAVHFNEMVAGLREREWMKATFARYVSQHVAEKILKNRDTLVFKGELRRVTILFVDIRGFTSLAETLKPAELLTLLNEYFAMMIDVIFKHDGTLDKFVGDQIMAVYGAPLDQDQPALRAVCTAMDMQAGVELINTKRSLRGLPGVGIGIGINTGDVVAGNIGSEKRMEYTVIGDEVNLAQRIEAISQKGQVLVSESTYRAVEKQVDVLPLPETKVKGRKNPVSIYSVLRYREEPRR
ncbi:MAG: HAMP domain-containing protein [Lentisphaerae bacterium]|nr:HAMP domain-containing protein [Lentisphaerota bacterium]